MQNNVNIGIHSDGRYIGGVYNMLSSFSVGLYDAFLEKNLEVKYTDQWIKEDIMPRFFVGFNSSGQMHWELILSKQMFNISWLVDSVFYQNIDAINHYRSFPSFSCICLSDDDNDAVNYFMPDLQRITLPLAVSPKLWYSNNSERTKDIVFLASIKDPEEILEEIKPFLAKDKSLYPLFIDMYNYSLLHPDENFWNIYNKFGLLQRYNDKINQGDIYSFYLQRLTYAVSYKKRIELINSLSDYNIEVYGNGPWEKFLKGNAKHKGSVDLFDAIDVLKHSKIAINLQPMQILGGIHDRIMNSSAAGALVFTDKNKMIYDSYGDSLCYFDPKDFAGLSEQIRYYLEHDKEREEKAKKAQDVTLKQHTWRNRADSLI